MVVYSLEGSLTDFRTVEYGVTFFVTTMMQTQQAVLHVKPKRYVSGCNNSNEFVRIRSVAVCLKLTLHYSHMLVCQIGF